MSALMLVRMPEHRLICPISKNSSPDAHLKSKLDKRQTAMEALAEDMEDLIETYGL